MELLGINLIYYPLIIYCSIVFPMLAFVTIYVNRAISRAKKEIKAREGE